VTFSTPGEASLVSLTITAGNPVVLSTSYLTTVPANAPVTVNVYNSDGVLVCTFNTTAGSSVDLSSEPPGT
jgi:hypothetical protein